MLYMRMREVIWTMIFEVKLYLILKCNVDHEAILVNLNVFQLNLSSLLKEKNSRNILNDL